MASQAAECNIKVMCRFRPLNDAEKRNNSTFTARFLNDSCCAVEDKLYAFDRVFQPQDSQQKIYELTAKPLVSNVLSGYNGTIFAYGQTSSGKTYTMEGVVGDAIFQGIIPRTVAEIFSQISNADPDVVHFRVKVSNFEIYMERIRDLLDGSKRNLEIREDQNRVPYVKGCSERIVSNIEEMMAAIEDGKAAREIDSTNMNERSSRSHSICLITITQVQALTQKKLTGKLCLVDLAGSEKVSKTGADGKQLEEAKKINSSLSVLRKVIFALASGESFVSYRESKLTRVLQESLGGNAKTTVIVCCSPASYNVEETKSTLQFGISAKTVKNVVTVNEELTVDELKRLVEKERAVVRRQDKIIEAAFQELEKWRNGNYVARTEWVDPAKSTFGTGITPVKAISHLQSPRVAGIGLPVPMDENFEDMEQDGAGSDVDDQPHKDNLELTATYVAEKALLLTKLAEAECEKDLFKGRMDEIKEQLGAAIAAIEAVPDEAAFGMNSPLDILRDISHKLDGFRNGGCTLTGEEIDAEKDEEDDADDVMQITTRQEDINRQMETLLRQIKDKEQLICETIANADNIEKMRHKYEIEMNELRQRIESLQREKEEIQSTAARQSIASKISETRRLRLQEVEKQLAECKRKVQDLQKFEKMKSQNEEMIKKLRSEVDTMKTTRVKLMRQMRDDNERYRKTQQKIEREMDQLRQQGKKRQYEIEKEKRDMDKQLTVFRRKYDEAVAVNKRLQQQLEKQKSVRNDRFADMQESAKLIQEIKAFLKDEINFQVTAEDARLHREQLERQRNDLKDQLHKLERDKKRLKNHKKVIFGREGSLDENNSTSELARIELEISSLQEEVGLREAQIEQLQKQIDAIDPKAKESQRWVNIHTVVAAKCALKLLFDMAIDAHVENLLTAHRLSDAESKNDDLALNLAQLEKTLRENERRAELMMKQHQDAADERAHEYQKQISYMLQQLLKLTGGCRLGEEEMAAVMELYDKVNAMQNLSEQLERKRNENRKLTQELSKATVRSKGNRQFFGRCTKSPIPEDVDTNYQSEESDSKSTEVPKNGGQLMKRSRSSRLRHQPDYFGKVVDSTSAIHDPNSPSYRRIKGLSGSAVAPKRPNVGCNCESGDCDDMCICKTKKKKCTGLCACVLRESCDNFDDSLSGLVLPEKENGTVAGDNMDSTFVVPSSAAAQGQPTGAAMGSLASVKMESGDAGASAATHVPTTPLDNLGILKPKVRAGSFFKPLSSRPKLFDKE